MATYKLYSGNLNPLHVFGCPPDRNPDCAQPENPIGYMGMHREYEEVYWSEIMRRLSRVYPDTFASDLVVGDRIEIMLIPSFSHVESIATHEKVFQTGFTVDIEVDNGLVPSAPWAGGPVLTTVYPEGLCSATTVVPAATTEDMMVGPDVTSSVFMGDPAAPVMTGGRAGVVTVVIASVPATIQEFAPEPDFAVRVNYRNHLECRHQGTCKPAP